MVTVPGEKTKMDGQGQQGKKPIMLSLGLITDFLMMGFSIAILLLIASMNLPNKDLMEGSEKIPSSKHKLPSTKGTIQIIEATRLFGGFATLFAWTTAFFGGIYSLTIHNPFFGGKKYSHSCCPGLRNQIQREIGSPIEDGNPIENEKNQSEI